MGQRFSADPPGGYLSDIESSLNLPKGGGLELWKKNLAEESEKLKAEAAGGEIGADLIERGRLLRDKNLRTQGWEARRRKRVSELMD
jgi:hypothetical protein